MACVSAGTWLRSGTRSASFSVNNGFSFSTARGGRSSSVSSVNYTTASATPPLMLECSLFSSSLSPSFRSSFSGLSLEVDLNINGEGRKQAGHRLIVRAGKKFQLCQTKRNRSRKSLARTHGFRLRMRTPGGRAVLQRRRAKGRRVLCPKTNPSSGKRA